MTKAPEILLIDDDDDDRLLFALAMKHIITTMTFAMENNVESVLPLINENYRPKIIFLDLNLPLKSGLDFLEDLHNRKLTSLIRVIVFTTSVNPFDKERSMQLGASGFLKKPSDFQELRRMLTEAILDQQA